MSDKAKSRCRLGMQKENNTRHNYLNVIKLGSYDPTGEYLNNN